MLISALDCKNPLYDAYVNVWGQCNALYKGGEHFKAMIEEFLPPNPVEPPEVYATRRREAAYTSYMGPIVDYFVAWLFSGQFSLSARKAGTPDKVEVDSVYSEFEADVGGDVSLNDFLRDRATDALVTQCAHWLIELPAVDKSELDQLDLAAYKARGLGRPTLRSLSRDQIYDWECDSLGKLNWVIIHDITQIRPDPRTTESREVFRETWRIYDKQNVETYIIEYKQGERPASTDNIVPTIPATPHRFKELPLVSLNVNEGLWIGDRVRAAQIEHFRANSAKNWLIRRTCYGMPVLFLEDPNLDLGTMGAGYYLKLGMNDKFEWTSPKNTPFDVLQKTIDSNRDEIYRIVHQMAQGMDNNAETTGRSADSKQIDTACTRILLNAYGKIIRKAIEETLEILSDALNDDDVYWSVEGFAGYDTATVGELVSNANELQLLNIPSKTFRRVIKTQVAMAATAEADPAERNLIKQEIKESIEQMEEIDEIKLPPELDIKLEQQRLKNEGALKVADKNATAAKTAAKAGKAKPG